MAYVAQRAIFAGDLSLLKYLVEKDHQLTVQDLMCATIKFKKNIVEYIVDQNPGLATQHTFRDITFDRINNQNLYETECDKGRSPIDKASYHKDKTIFNILKKAARKNAVEYAKKHIHTTSKEGLTGLEIATLCGDLEAIKEIHAKGGKITQIALNIAIRQGKKEVYTYLHNNIGPLATSSQKKRLNDLSNKSLAKRRSAMRDGTSLRSHLAANPLDMHHIENSGVKNATLIGDIALIKYLIENDDTVTKSDLAYVAQRAIFAGKLSLLKYLVEKGHQLTVNDLVCATHKNNNEIASYILDRHPEFANQGAFRDITNIRISNERIYSDNIIIRKGKTPLSVAFYDSSTDYDGSSELFKKLRATVRKNTVEYAKNHINTTSKEGLTGLEIAAFYGNLKDIKDIIAKGGTITELALSIAIRQGKKDVYNYLADHITPSKYGLNHISKLKHAHSKKWIQFRKTHYPFHFKGKRINDSRLYYAENPLDIQHIEDSTLKNAIFMGDLNLVKKLIENGFSIQESDTAYAKKLGKTEIYNYLS